MEATWLNILWYDLLGVILLGLMTEMGSQGVELKQFARRWSGFVGRQRRPQARVASRGLPGLVHRLGCVDGQVEAISAVEPTSPPPPWPQSKRGRRRKVEAIWQFCPDQNCSYYGWPGLDNLRSNGHPHSSPWRQWQCQACGGYFVETRGTPLYRRSGAVEGVGSALTALAEGLSLAGTARLGRVEASSCP